MPKVISVCLHITAYTTCIHFSLGELSKRSVGYKSIDINDLVLEVL